MLKPTQIDAFQKALILEWHKRQPLLANKPITSIYFGGGTPSLLPPAFIESILKLTTTQGEITIEANPEDVTLSLLQDYQSLGINRLSLGIQSLHDPTLKNIGRAHTSSQAIDAIHTAQKAGFTNITIDLMYDLPHQNLPTWKQTLSHIPDLPISHISLYNLTFEEPSLFHRKQKTLTPHLPSQEESLAMLKSAIDTFETSGHKRYEISAFGTPSIHNTGYWTGRPFLGFGPSAFSYWDKRRFRNTANLTKYIAALENDEPWVDFTEKLPPDDHLREMLAVGLRLTQGLNLPIFTAQYGNLPPDLLTDLEKLKQDNLLTQKENTLKLTEKGQLFYDSVAETIV